MSHRIIDTGTRTLEVIATSHHFNEWLFSEIKEHIRGDVLEIGSGIGNISKYLLNNGFDTTLSDMEVRYLDILKQKFQAYPNLQGVECIDLMQPTAHANRYDTVIAINVVEHIEDDTKAMRYVWSLLKPGGTFIVLVPAYEFLYCRFDKLLGHYRRYTQRSLQQRLCTTGFVNIRSKSFNLLGIAGWLFFGKILNRPYINHGEMKLFNNIVRFAKFADRITCRKLGLSVICIAQKN